MSKDGRSAGKRNLNIDLVKIIAMLGVICLHTTRPFGESSEYYINLSSILYRSAVVSIPLFFIASGYLLCPRQDTDYKYVIAKIFRIIRYVFIFCFGYWLLHGPAYHFKPTVLIYQIYCSLTGTGTFYVFWYFAAFIGVLLLLPIITKVYKKPLYFCVLTTVFLLIQNIVFLHNLTWGG